MLELTDTARKELDAYFADKPKETLRIYAANSCSGPRLALALDNNNENDTVEEQGGYNFCIDNNLLAQIQGVKIDLTYMGFMLEPTVPLPVPEGGGCGSCCGGCH